MAAVDGGVALCRCTYLAEERLRRLRRRSRILASLYDEEGNPQVVPRRPGIEAVHVSPQLQ